MHDKAKLTLIKTLHTLIWIFFNIVVGYMLYAVIINKLDNWLWLCYVLILTEGLVLLLFKWTCPLTLLARNYSDSARDNFDIFLPEWLAKYTKLIYTCLSLFILAFTIYRLLQN